ncbi:MAG: hypothetical protein ACD_11C00004G0040 [uncultured bacterium]|nr:MAG: hypothetical protein ACD_11C00004G0040 [uncultured bacterium]HBR71938.1 hypothetical protein [Candidatus Moranbacteria bacterium]
MGKKIKKLLDVFYGKSKECFEIIFQSAANNQMRIMKAGNNPHQSYLQLKSYQKHLRKLAAKVFLAAIFLFIGILVGPAFIKQEMRSEIYVPNGKGDILISNVSKNQATVIFKTMDSLNDNKPLATVAKVGIYKDPEHKVFIKETEVNDFAVTHVVHLEDLEEGRIYYPIIYVSEEKDMSDIKAVSNWGGIEPIAVYATGEMIPACAIANNTAQGGDAKKNDVNLLGEEKTDLGAPVAPSLEDNNYAAIKVAEDTEDNSLRVLGMQNETYLHGKDKVQAIISWDTNIPAKSVLVYRSEKDNVEKEISINGESSKKHAAVITTLQTGTVYYFKAKVENEKGEKVVSSEYSLRTPRAKETILEIMENNFKSLLNKKRS